MSGFQSFTIFYSLFLILLQKPVKYPNEAGLFLPKDRFLRLEVHYNNPDLLGDIVDFSGFKFSLTGTRRPYNIGILEVGKIYTPTMGIPQNQKSFVWNGICPAACTKKVCSDFIRRSC